MNIAIIGTGYVGLVTGTCFAEMGVHVTCVDVDSKKIEGLRSGIIPIYEPNLDVLVAKNSEKGRLQFETDIARVIDKVDVIFSAVGTPPGEDGSADLKYVLEVASTVGKLIDRYVLFVTKSTVPVGTAEKIRNTIQKELDQRGVDLAFDVASNPEFLKEGDAINDFMRPDRIVVGVDSEKATRLMEVLYKPFTLNGNPVIFMDIVSAELTKYAANSMLATRISFMNDMANLCEIVGADINMVRKGIGTDSRIGDKFLYAGCGYGGSCFPKDVKALIRTSEEKGHPLRILQAVEAVNESQKEVLFKKLMKHFDGSLQGKTVALWGLSFKPQTDDMREATSVVLIDQMAAHGVRINAYDPVAFEEAEKMVGNKINYCKDIYETVIDADAIILVTEWKEFRLPNWKVIEKLMKEKVIIDGRNIYDKEVLRHNGFTYYGIGIQ